MALDFIFCLFSCLPASFGVISLSNLSHPHFYLFFLWLIVREMSYVQLEVPSLLWVWDQGYLPQAHISSSAGAD